MDQKVVEVSSLSLSLFLSLSLTPGSELGANMMFPSVGSFWSWSWENTSKNRPKNQRHKSTNQSTAQKSQDWILFSKLHVLRQFSLRLFNSLWATCFCDWLSCQAKPKPPPSAEVLGKEDRKDEQDEKECKKDQDPGNPKTPEHSPTCGAWHLRTLKREKMECNSCARFGRSRLDAMFANIPEGKLFVLLRIFCLQQCKCSACSHVSDVKLQWVHAWSVDLSGAFIRNFLR